jgi:PKD repeat protein
MKKFYPFIFLLLPFFNHSQSVTDAAVQLEATILLSPPTITIAWPGNATTTQYTVYRKLKTGTSWGTPVATLSGTVNQYVDNTVSSGVSYEYRVDRSGSGYFGYGFINAGMEIPEVASRGNLVLLVDSFFIGLSTEINRLMDDLEGDGWRVMRIDVSRTGSVFNVKSKVVNAYNQDPANTHALFILGHVPVPYSGNINPDGHPDHLGAWPTDDYYADVNGTWTDAMPATTTVSPARTQNLPGDGKFDQSTVPTPVELQTGRVDFFNMPAFAQTEMQLMQNYLNKDHDYRKKIFTAQKRAVIDDNFGFMSNEAFAASGYNNFSSLVGNANIIANDYFTSMTGNTYLWSYGCGPGSYNSSGGIGTTSNFAAANLQGVFTMLFGSYFGDWDVQNSFLRAPLAQGRMLTCSWSGRPHHQYHHMALGETVGYGMMITQNYQNPLYYSNIYGITGNWIHNGLMGDPSLRNDVVAPVSNVVASMSGYNCNVSWNASPEPGLLGYNLYMKNDSNQNYVKVNASPIAGTTYTDNCLKYKGTYKYMVRALKLENTPSAGSYYNMSEGIADTVLNNNNSIVTANFAYYNSTNTQVIFNNLSYWATNYSWNLGVGTSTAVSPVATYSNYGTYTVTLIASNACFSDTITKIITVYDVGIKENSADKAMNLYPNPTRGQFVLELNDADPGTLEISSSTGELVYISSVGSKQQKVDVSTLSKGIYSVKFTDKDRRTFSKKLIIE